jgi:2-dehydro-3-deoxyphosphogluconate aldolase/(4S)-4-hydroxy-2-oxoglutarate aldolase
LSNETLEALCAHRVIPVVPALASEDTLALASALKDGGLPVLEMTLRSENALELLRALAGDVDLLVGAGTVIRPEQVDQALDAGARFVVTPGVSPAVLVRCRELGMPVIPGVATATEVIAALDHGIQVLKLFPAEASGGIAMLKALAAPFPEVRFVPTGGVSAENLESYLRLPAVKAVGGSWMVAPALQGDFAAVARLTAEAVSVAAEARR